MSDDSPVLPVVPEGREMNGPSPGVDPAAGVVARQAGRRCLAATAMSSGSAVLLALSPGSWFVLLFVGAQITALQLVSTFPGAAANPLRVTVRRTRKAAELAGVNASLAVALHRAGDVVLVAVCAVRAVQWIAAR